MRRLLLCLAIALPLLYAAPMTTLTILVKNKEGKPIEGASVQVKFVKSRSMVKLGKKVIKDWGVHTNQEGSVKIPPIPQGTILIQVNAKNYQTFGQEYDVDEEEKTIEITMNPPQQQYSAH
jgi:hypothetical protein